MSRIRMAVRIQNLTEHALVLRGSGLKHGSWTGSWRPQPRVEVGQTHEFRAEGSLVAGIPSTGTEGFVTYGIGDDPALTLHIGFDTPLVESQYGNTFHVYAPTDFDISSSGGQGHHAILEVVVQPTSTHRVPGFASRVRGLHFRNHWDKDLPSVTVGTLWNKLLDALPDDAADALDIVRADPNYLPLTHADGGLCGGMVFAVMDYLAAHQLPPATTDTPSSTEDPIFQHVRDRLIDSFDILGGGSRYLAYSAPSYPNGDEGVVQAIGLWAGRSWVTYREEWPKIRADIDNGRLSPLGLIQTDELSIGNNHQVLAHGYRRSGQQVQLMVYDPNAPDAEVILEFNVTDTTGEVHVARYEDGVRNDGKHRIFAIFRTDGYSPHTPPQGRPLDAMSLRDALECVTGSRAGSLLNAVTDPHPPIHVRNWIRTI